MYHVGKCWSTYRPLVRGTRSRLVGGWGSRRREEKEEKEREGYIYAGAVGPGEQALILEVSIISLGRYAAWVDQKTPTLQAGLELSWLP